MARQEYSDPSAEAVARIETSVDEIEVLVQDIKNTDLANIEENIYSPLVYKPFVYEYHGSPLANVWTEVLNINGEGFLETAIEILNIISSSYAHGLQIFADGIKIYESYAGNSNNSKIQATGILNSKEIQSANRTSSYDAFTAYILSPTESSGAINQNFTIDNLSIGTLPILNTRAKASVFLISSQIGFKTNLTINFKKSTDAFNMVGWFKGGVK